MVQAPAASLRGCECVVARELCGFWSCEGASLEGHDRLQCVQQWGERLGCIAIRLPWSSLRPV